LFIAMNRFKVIKGNEAAFEELWRTRDSYLDDIEGLVEFSLLRGPGADDHTLYASHSIWQNRAAFDTWIKSDAFRVVHHDVGDGKSLYIGHPQFEGFDTILTTTGIKR
jgi:heme-degrading monooxygenase HmoA